jgi:hypothetical protein
VQHVEGEHPAQQRRPARPRRGTRPGRRGRGTTSAADMARVLHTLTARSITYVTFSDPDALAAEHDGVLCLEAGGAWNLSADSRGITA